jgi:hypothetical protein
MRQPEIDPHLPLGGRERLVGDLDNDRGVIPAGHIDGHRDRRRTSGQLTGPADDRNIPHARQPEATGPEHSTPGGVGEPDRLPTVPA